MIYPSIRLERCRKVIKSGERFEGSASDCYICSKMPRVLTVEFTLSAYSPDILLSILCSQTLKFDM